MNISIEEILTLMDKMQQTGLGSLCLKEDGFSLAIKAKQEKEKVVVCAEPQAAPVPFALSPNHPEAEPAPEKAENKDGKMVTSPIVGTFYAAPSPEKAPFVRVGSSVKKGDVLFIIESMKLMNEVESEFDGTVAEILVEDGQPVEFGQPIMRLE